MFVGVVGSCDKLWRSNSGGCLVRGAPRNHSRAVSIPVTRKEVQHRLRERGFQSY